MNDNPIIVTGCQRSGTTIGANILGQLKNYVVWDDLTWFPNTKGIYVLQSMIKTGRTKLVIQSPTVLHNFVELYYQVPEVHFVGVKRKTEDIVASMKRVKWYQNEVYNDIDFYYDHIRFMNNQWGLLKQILPKDSWTEVKYNEFKQYPQFIPKEQRENFTTKQWEVDKPIGPRYWTENPEENSQINSSSTKLQIKKKSTENTG